MRIAKRKVEEIKKAYSSGEIKELGLGFSVPSRFFALGITPRIVNEVVKTIKDRGC